MLKAWKDFVSDMNGVTLIEYAMIAALIAIALSTILRVIGTNLTGVFTNVSNKL